ncbi:MAG: hypothetical protein J6W18_08970 [Bacteroidaceae bacterium]|nr:hypothetical protein [Bacteroidaceae bacterium]
MIESLSHLLQSLGEILGAVLLIYLLFFILGMYTVIYRVMPSGQKKKVGYLWRIKGEYVLYDSLLPLFSSSRIGFIKGYEIRPLVVNVQQNKVQKTLGTFTDDGKVYDLNGNPVAHCENTQTRTTAVIDNNGDKVGFLRGALRAKQDLIVRGAGFAILHEKEEGDRSVFDVRVGFKDLMLPAALAFMVLFYPFRLLTETFTSSYSALYMLVMLLYYVLMVGILYVIKYEKTMQNQSIDYVIGLIDRNVGVKWLNILIIITAVIALRISTPALLPLFAVILAGFLFNLACFNGKWYLEQPGSSWSGRIPVIPIPQNPAPASSSKRITRTFSWAPIMALKGFKDCKDEIELSFAESDFNGVNSLVRMANPFRSGPVNSEDDLSNRAKQVIAGAKTADGSEDSAIAKILNSAYQLTLQYGLADFEMFDLVLGFVQANVKYVIDEESESIGKVREYFRYASETLVDREGDCDCKSVLAYRMFEKLGVDVDMVTVKSGGKDVYNHVAIVLKNKADAPIQLPPEYVEFYPGQGVYCESTGHGFHPGDVPKDVDKDSIITIS